MALAAAGFFAGPPAMASYTATINPDTTWGTWQGWGCSLAWWARVLGRDDTLSDILFTTNSVPWNGGTLPGLGLNIVRYNVGACSSNSCDGMSMDAPNLPWYRQIDAYWTNSANADPASDSWRWSADANQRAALLKAKARGANMFELFDNSPVWWMCANQDPAGSDNGTDNNLPACNDGQDAVYLATVVEYAKTNWGVTFNSVEAFNEPASDWWKSANNQEGCHFDAGAQEAVIGRLRHELDKRGLDSTIISASDENTYDLAIQTWNAFDAATRLNTGRINVHGYEYDGGRRSELYHLAQAAGKGLWNSEYGDGDASGLSLVRHLNLDFHRLHNVAWCYWQPFDSRGWGLIRCRLPHYPTAVNYKYYLLAQYTRHIRPGTTIIDGGKGDVMAAYDPPGKTLVIVCANYDRAQSVTFDLHDFNQVTGPVTRWETQVNGAENLYREYANGASLDGKRFTSWFPTNTVQTFEIQNVVR